MNRICLLCGLSSRLDSILGEDFKSGKLSMLFIPFLLAFWLQRDSFPY